MKKAHKFGRSMELWKTQEILSNVVPMSKVFVEGREAQWPSPEGPACILLVQLIKGQTEALRRSSLQLP